jgi:2-polyprenyl-3-methyl-5-hydroxy-6-metoxy-1,4-benzoquinol methylase
MKEFWDKRYAEKEMAYGEEPNVFFASQIVKLNAGKILLPAEGEGRNAIHSAKLGWEVSAFDISEEGKQKAEKLAENNNVSIEYFVGGFDDINYQKEYFDCIALVFAHFPPHLKSQYHKHLDGYLKKDGIIILEGFSKKQIEYPKSGGPKNMDMLFSMEEIKQDFSNYEIIELSEKEVFLDEGSYHKGKSSVIRFIGKKN